MRWKFNDLGHLKLIGKDLTTILFYLYLIIHNLNFANNNIKLHHTKCKETLCNSYTTLCSAFSGTFLSWHFGWMRWLKRNADVLWLKRSFPVSRHSEQSPVSSRNFPVTLSLKECCHRMTVITKQWNTISDWGTFTGFASCQIWFSYYLQVIPFTFINFEHIFWAQFWLQNTCITIDALLIK